MAGAVSKSSYHHVRQVSLLAVFALLCLKAFSQYPVGHRTLQFTDPARNNRQIPAEVYYPAESAGNNTPVMAGAFPVIVFGHGYLMPYSAYGYFRDAMVPEGYFVVFPTTEGSLFPNHLNFGLDLAFLVGAMQNEGTTPASPFYKHVDTTSAVMGHSMGGGASFLACQGNTLPTAMVTFAAAETTPSAIAAAAGVGIPSLVFAASEDCVTPPATNQVPMYDALAGACKVFVSINGGGHCYFADYNLQCSLGETGCQQNFTISREQQQDAALDFTRPFLDYFLRQNYSAWITFNDSLNMSQRITSAIDCTVAGAESPGLSGGMRLFPNPAADVVTLQAGVADARVAMVRILDPAGRVVQTYRASCTNGLLTLDVSALPAGFWVVSVDTRQGRGYLKLTKR